MYNATTNLTSRSLLALVCVFIALSTVCCKKTDNTYAEADALVTQAKSAIDSGDFDHALVLLDSLDRAYPQAITQRETGMKLRPAAMQGSIGAQIVATDTILAKAERTIAELQSAMVLHNNDAIRESYYTPKRLDRLDTSLSGRTGITVRVNNPSGSLYIVSSVNPGRIGQRYVLFEAPDGTTVSTDTIATDSELNYVHNNTELLEMLPRYCTRIAPFLAQYAGSPIAVTIAGDNGTRSVKLSAEQTQAYADAASLSMAIQQAQQAQLELERLNRSLEIARSQAAK